jgi:hypothetical protein
MMNMDPIAPPALLKTHSDGSWKSVFYRERGHIAGVSTWLQASADRLAYSLRGWTQYMPK